LPSQSANGKYVGRQWLNTVSGWGLGFGLLALMWATDPFGVYLKWADSGQGITSWNAVFYSWLFVLSLGGYSVFARPRVEITDYMVILRNVFRDVFIPRGSILHVDAFSGKYLRIWVGSAVYVARGAERTNLSVFLSKGGVAGTIAAQIDRGGQHEPHANANWPTKVAWRRLELPEWILIAGWLLYLTLGVLRAA
jgi:hypothetical protein